jgi:transcriptional antiterminator RfaH
MTLNWYALRSKPREEDALWRRLASDGREVFYPRLRVNPVNPRAKKVKPYFPGYMFVQADLAQIGLSAFQWMPHSLGLVFVGEEPAHVPENLIHEIRRRVEEIAAAGGEALDGLKPGDRVRVQRGPFAGYEALFDTRLPGTERVRVLLEFINKRQIPVELDAGQIEQVKRRR